MRPYTTTSYPGDKILTTVAMEPGADFDNPHGDFYQVEIFEHPEGKSFKVESKGDLPPTGHMTFSSLGQLEEFHQHIADIIRREKGSLEKA